MALWDEADAAHIAFDSVRGVPRAPLPDAVMSRRPGVYLIFYVGALECYRRVARGTWPVYAGAAQSLGERHGRHRTNTRPIGSLTGGQDLLILGVATETYAGALFAEGLLRDLLQPVWNQPFCAGFGSRAQGASRTRQAPPPFTLLHPGRHVGTGHSTVDVPDLERRVSAHLDASVRFDLWPAL